MPSNRYTPVEDWWPATEQEQAAAAEPRELDGEDKDVEEGAVVFDCLDGVADQWRRLNAEFAPRRSVRGQYVHFVLPIHSRTRAPIGWAHTRIRAGARTINPTF